MQPAPFSAALKRGAAGLFANLMGLAQIGLHLGIAFVASMNYIDPDGF